ncbi:MAG: hypothetical protein GDA56_09715 [Hormoscilla sp. GM7CHS1pb]|nr:hypothetical protein [Hormoscilla sp. GM7CHS1pb]
MVKGELPASRETEGIGNLVEIVLQKVKYTEAGLIGEVDDDGCGSFLAENQGIRAEGEKNDFGLATHAAVVDTFRASMGRKASRKGSGEGASDAGW